MLLVELFQKPNKTLYVCRHLVNTKDFIAWIREQGFDSRLPAAQFHVTIAYSKDKVDWNKAKPKKNIIRIKGGKRQISIFKDSIVLQFTSKTLHHRWKELCDDVHCSWNHPSYKPHITISYEGEDLNVKDFKPYEGDLVFGPEEFREIESDFKSNFDEIAIKPLSEGILSERTEINETMTLGHDLDPYRAYEIFRRSYEKETGQAWSIEKFMSRARDWTFYGDEDGFIAVRTQRSGPKKLVGVAGDPRSILKGISELQAEGGAIWGAVSEPLARMAKKRGFIVPSFFPGGGMLIRTLISTIPSSVFGGETPEVNKDGSININYPDTGTATKYIIGNKAYFTHALGLPQIAEKIKEIPGAKMLFKLMGLSI